MIARLMKKENLKQFISYLFVGGISAVVEWVAFFVLDSVVEFQYYFATIFAFIISTSTNLFLGKQMTFKNSNRYEGELSKEVIAIFGVSLIGLFFNLVLMYLFVNVIGMNTKILRTVAKVIATGIVFIWNFLIRKLVVYKD